MSTRRISISKAWLVRLGLGLFAMSWIVWGSTDRSAAQAPVNLTGESVFSTGTFTALPDSTCQPDGTGTLHFTASGIASGPFPGSFNENGTVVFGPRLAPGALNEVLNFSASFSIDSPAGQVAGTKTLGTLTNPNPFGAFDFFAKGECRQVFGFGTNYFIVPVAYEATITTGAGTFLDSGVGVAAGASERSISPSNFFNEDFLSRPTAIPCATCDPGTSLVVDEDVTVDLNPAVPTCDDGSTEDLCLYFSYDKSGDPSTWKAVFNVEGRKLLIKDNATVTVKTVGAPGGNNQKSPGIVIQGTCELTVEGDLDGNGEPGGVVVQSINQQAGSIAIRFDGDITINGLVRNEVVGTNGKPGAISIASCCGDVVVGSGHEDGHNIRPGRIETLGVDPGGSDIDIRTCCDGGNDGDGGDILINGVVRAIHKYGSTPTINVVAFHGAVSIDGTTDLGEEVLSGTTYRRTSGVYVQTLGATNGGDINIQAQDDVTVTGNWILNKNRTQFGAVAIKTNNTNGQGGNGGVNVVSLSGSIVASDRAFDVENRFNHAVNTSITLSAKHDIALSVTGAVNNGAVDGTKAVVSSQGGVGGQGGRNTLLAHTGEIMVGASARVLANAPGGADGVNILAGCRPPGVTRMGTVLPIDALGDDTSCPAGPDALFERCEEDFGSAHSAQKVNNEHDEQHGSEADTRASSPAPPRVAVVPSPAAEQQH